MSQKISSVKLIKNFCNNPRIFRNDVKEYNRAIKFKKCIDIEFDINLRLDVIKLCIDKVNAKSYLEIGCQDDEVFANIYVDKKSGVDPMRHRKAGRRLNRTASHRKAMFKNMSVSLFEHELIKTTLPKAKELRRVAEPLITLAKEDSVANRRLAFARTRSKEAVGKLFNELGPRYEARPGGYIRIMKCGFRPGDNAPMAYVELVDRPEASDE